MQIKLLVLLFFFVSSVNSQQSCEGIFEYPDLNSLNQSNGGKDWFGSDSEGYKYNWNLCGPQTTYPICQNPSVSICQNGDDVQGARSAGDYATQKISIQSGTNAVLFLYFGSSSNSCGINRQTNVTVTCDRSSGAITKVTSPPSQLGNTGASQCQYSIGMSSPFACQGPTARCCFYSTENGTDALSACVKGIDPQCPPPGNGYQFEGSTPSVNCSCLLCCYFLNSQNEFFSKCDSHCTAPPGYRIFSSTPVTSCSACQSQKRSPVGKIGHSQEMKSAVPSQASPFHEISLMSVLFFPLVGHFVQRLFHF